MRKMRAMAGAATVIALALGVAGSSFAADLANLSGQSCGELTGTWHFVNNQTDGAPAGMLDAGWSSGEACIVGASKVKSRVQHFYCTASGELLYAVTDLPGRLVLSDFTCEQKCDKDCPPPKK